MKIGHNAAIGSEKNGKVLSAREKGSTANTPNVARGSEVGPQEAQAHRFGVAKTSSAQAHDFSQAVQSEVCGSVPAQRLGVRKV